MDWKHLLEQAGIVTGAVLALPAVCFGVGFGLWSGMRVAQMILGGG